MKTTHFGSPRRLIFYDCIFAFFVNIFTQQAVFSKPTRPTKTYNKKKRAFEDVFFQAILITWLAKLGIKFCAPEL